MDIVKELKLLGAHKVLKLLDQFNRIDAIYMYLSGIYVSPKLIFNSESNIKNFFSSVGCFYLLHYLDRAFRDDFSNYIISDMLALYNKKRN